MVASAIDCGKVTSVETIHIKHVDGLLYVLKNTGDDSDGSEDDREKGLTTSICHTFHAWTLGRVELVAL